MPLTKNELDGFQYLCGYIVKNLIKNLYNHKNYKTEQYQTMIAILEGICYILILSLYCNFILAIAFSKAKDITNIAKQLET